MTTYDLKTLSESLTPTEFETLLRLRLKAAFANLQTGPGLIMLVVGTEYGKPKEMGLVHWHIGHQGDQTKGEILSDCVIEHNRRQGFTASCKLNLLSGPTEYEVVSLAAEGDEPAVSIATALDDEIPF